MTLKERLAAIIAEVEKSELSADDAKALLDGARALAAVVARHRSFGRSFFRLLQTDDELKLVTDLVGADDMLALCLVATPMRNIIYQRIRQPNGSQHRMNMSRSACTASVARLEWSIACGYDLLKGFSHTSAQAVSSSLFRMDHSLPKAPGELTMDAIAAQGDKSTALWAAMRGCHIGVDACIIAASAPIEPHLALQMVLHLRTVCRGRWGAPVITAAATRGDVAMLQQFRAAGCPWDAKAVTAAVKSQQWPALRHLRENGCVADDWACEAAAQNGDLEMLQFVREGGWAPYTFQHRDGELGCRVLRAAAQGGHLDLIAWAVSDGCPIGSHDALLQKCAAFGQTDVMRWALQHGCTWEDDEPNSSEASQKWTCLSMAATFGHAAMVLYILDEHGLQPPYDGIGEQGSHCLTIRVATAGQLEVLQLLIERGFHWDAEMAERYTSIDGLNEARHDDDRKRRVQAVVEWIQQQTVAEVAGRRRRESLHWAAQRERSFLEVAGAISAHNEQRDTASGERRTARREATHVRPCVLPASPPEAPEPVQTEVRFARTRPCGRAALGPACHSRAPFRMAATRPSIAAILSASRCASSKRASRPT